MSIHINQKPLTSEKVTSLGAKKKSMLSWALSRGLNFDSFVVDK